MKRIALVAILLAVAVPATGLLAQSPCFAYCHESAMEYHDAGYEELAITVFELCMAEVC